MLSADTIRGVASEVVTELVRRPVSHDEPLISSGLVDSLSILKIIAGLETRLQISVPSDRVQPDDFDSVDLIVETVQRVTE